MNAPTSSPAQTAQQPTAATPPAPPEAKPNGAAPAETPPPTPQPNDEAKRISELEAQAKRIAQERMAAAAERRAHKQELLKREQELQAREEKYKAWEAERADRLRNPAKYLSAEYGPDWYDKLSQVQLNGAPPAGLIASEVDEKVSQVRKEFEEYKAQVQREREAEVLARAQEQRDAYFRQAVAYARGAEEKYPLIHAFGLVENIPVMIQQHLEQTATVDPDTGEQLPGELLTAEQASQKLEEYLKQKYESAAQRIKPKAEPQAQEKQPSRAPEVPRRSLSTSLTGQIQPAAPRVESEAERRRRAIAAGEAIAAQRRTQA